MSAHQIPASTWRPRGSAAAQPRSERPPAAALAAAAVRELQPALVDRASDMVSKATDAIASEPMMTWPFIIILAYFLTIPVIMAKKWFNHFYNMLGPIRYHVMMFLLLSMTALPIKMVLRWLFNLKYIVGIPEFFFNI